MHSTDNLNDTYLGSGHRLRPSIRKYGRSNHVRVIIEMCCDRQTLIGRETELVTESMLCDPMCLNLSIGGSNPRWLNTPQVNVKKQRRIDPLHPDAASKICERCGVSFSPRTPLTRSRLRAHMTKRHCSRKCATTVHNVTQKGTHRPEHIKRQISQSLKGFKRPVNVTKRIDPNHPDAIAKLCEWCGCSYEPKQPLTPTNVKAHKRKHVCSRQCALAQHNHDQSQRSSVSCSA